MFLLIDNYDSFTYNLVQSFLQLGRKPVVVRNDDPKLLSLATDPSLEMVCISPGPGHPDAAGQCLEFLRLLPKEIPVLGVCLGHQVLGRFASVTVSVGQHVMHGKRSHILHNQRGLFAGLSNPMTVGRYHSLLVRAEENPDLLQVTARTEEGEVMAMRFTDRPWVGVQFHPESILTPEGARMLANFPPAVLSDYQEAKNGKKREYAIPTSAELAARQAARQRNPVQLPVILENLAKGRDLTVDEAAEAFSRLMDGELSPSQAGALLLGLRAKGETADELGEAVNAVLERAVPVTPYPGVAIDVVGTGGDSKGSFNCSTATSLTLAGMGYKALKHGNRSVSSRSGSADVLEQLGIPLDTPPENINTLLDKDNFAFLFAPYYHPAFKNVMSVRRELGVRTLFNMLGPLTNPARPTHRLLGVAVKEHLKLVASTLARAGGSIGVIVYGAGGYDELTTMGEAEVEFVRDTETRSARLNPRSFGFEPCKEEDLTISGPEEGAKVLRELLTGKGPKAMRDMLTLNVGMALYLLSLTPDTKETIDPARGYDAARMEDAMQRAKDAVNAGAGRKFCHA